MPLRRDVRHRASAFGLVHQVLTLSHNEEFTMSKRIQEYSDRPMSYFLKCGRFFAWLVIAGAISFMVPTFIILAAHLARTYVHVWRVVLRLDPDCAYPAETAPPFGSRDCRELNGGTSKLDSRLP